ERGAGPPRAGAARDPRRADGPRRGRRPDRLEEDPREGNRPPRAAPPRAARERRLHEPREGPRGRERLPRTVSEAPAPSETGRRDLEGLRAAVRGGGDRGRNQPRAGGAEGGGLRSRD